MNEATVILWLQAQAEAGSKEAAYLLEYLEEEGFGTVGSA